MKTKSPRSVQVFIEISHRAYWRPPDMQTVKKTHDWVLCVKGKGGSDDIYHFVDKVMVYLHNSFKKPVRVLKDPPFELAESGYGSFTAKIEVYFQIKEKESPSMQTYHHNIFLPETGDGFTELSVVEKLTFTDVSEDFIQKVLRGGGTIIEDHDAVKARDANYKAIKRPHKHQDAIITTPQGISPDFKTCSKEFERRQLEMSLFGGGPEICSKKIKSEGTNSPQNSDNELVVKKKSHSDSLKTKNRKSSNKIVNKEIKSDAKPFSFGESKPLTKGEPSKKIKLEPEVMEAKSNTKDFTREILDENVFSEKKKSKSLESHENASSEIFESDDDCEKEVVEVVEEEQKSLAISGLPYYELETLHSKIMSLNPDDNEQLMMSYKIYKILQATGKGYEDDGACFDMNQLELSIILQIKDIMQC